MKILITLPKGNDVFHTFFTEKARREIEKLGEVVYNQKDRVFTKEELKEALKDIDVVFTGWGAQRFDEELLSQAKSLKMIAHTGGSVALLQSEALAKSDIIVLSGNKLYAESVAEGTLCYMLLAQRKLVEYINETAELGWAQTYRWKKGLWKKTIGLVGFGMIAQNLARMLQPFDVKLKIYSGYLSSEEAAKYNAEVCSLEELFETCDIVSVHSGLNEKNYHLIDKTCLGRMKENALLVNTARGAVINEADLIQELQKGKINAILDVYETEPLPMDSGLRGLPNAILVPHQGGPTTDVREMVTLALAEDIRRYTEGERNLVHQISSEYASHMTDEVRFKDRK